MSRLFADGPKSSWASKDGDGVGAEQAVVSAAGAFGVGSAQGAEIPLDGSSGLSWHRGRPAAGPESWKLQPHFSAQTGPISVPSSPNHEIATKSSTVCH